MLRWKWRIVKEENEKLEEKLWRKWIEGREVEDGKKGIEEEKKRLERDKLKRIEVRKIYNKSFRNREIIKYDDFMS